MIKLCMILYISRMSRPIYSDPAMFTSIATKTDSKDISWYVDTFKLALTKPHYRTTYDVRFLVGCKAEQLIMNIANPQVYGSIFEPTKYSVMRCWGNCGPKTICKATQIKRFNVTVIEFKNSSHNTKGGIIGRKVEYAENHECGCVINKEGLMDKAQCEREWCHNRIWDDDSYECKCKTPIDCTSNSVFNTRTCKCNRAEEKDQNILRVCYELIEPSADVSKHMTDLVPPHICKPMPTVVYLKPYIGNKWSPTVRYEPANVVVNRCVGSCRNTEIINYCTADDVRNQSMTIQGYRYNFEEDAYQLGKLITINVPIEHNCSCACTNTPTRNVCSQAEKFNSTDCGCDCINLEVKEFCLHDQEWSKNHRWDNHNCDCVLK